MRAVLAVFLMVVLQGCASVFTGTQDTITIITDPKDARVYMDGRHLGRGEVTFVAQRTFIKKSVPEIRIERPEYRTQEFKLQQTFNPAAGINFTFIYSWTTDFVTGAVFKYAPNSYMVQMVHEEEYGFTQGQLHQRFVFVNSDDVIMDISKGGGEYLDGMLSFYENPDESRHQVFLNADALMAAQGAEELYQQVLAALGSDYQE